MRKFFLVPLALGCLFAQVPDPEPEPPCRPYPACTGGGGGGPGSGPYDASLVRITSKDNILTIRNRDASRSIVALHLRGNGRHLNKITTIKAGSKASFQTDGAPLTLDGALWDDGSVTGPNTWGVENHYRLFQEIQRGGPAHCSSDPDAADSCIYARIWSRAFERSHGYAPIVFDDPDVTGPPKPPFYIVLNSWTTLGTLDGIIFAQTYGNPAAACDNSYLLQLGGVYHTMICEGGAACQLPNPNNNKPWMGVGTSATSACPQSVINGLAELVLQKGYYTSAYSEAEVIYVNNAVDSTYNIDSCIRDAYYSPPQVSLCQGTGNDDSTGIVSQ